MADDREVLREIWDGKIPVCFQLSPDDLTASVEQPDPLYLLVPGQSYFPLATDKVARHFQKFVDQNKQGEMWLEDESQPLKCGVFRTGNGKGDISYNFLIGQDGVVYEGRGWDVPVEFIDELGMQISSVVMIGNFDRLVPSQVSRNTLDDLIQCGQSSGYLAPASDLVTSSQMSGKALDEMIRRLEKGDK